VLSVLVRLMLNRSTDHRRDNCRPHAKEYELSPPEAR
jgi:hypothetical protein